MLINSIHPKNILSFGEDQPPIELAPLNILVGVNGAGKSNLMQCIKLLQSTVKAPPAPAADWLWQGAKEKGVARLEAVINYPVGSRNLRYWLEFTLKENQLTLTDERVENEHPDPGHGKSYFYFAYQKGWPVVNVKSVRRQLKREEIDTASSILAQRRDADAYPEIAWLGAGFGSVRTFLGWHFGASGVLRSGESPGDEDAFLAESYDNLAVVFGQLIETAESKGRVMAHLKAMMPDLQDVKVSMSEGCARLLVTEGQFEIPAERLSDGFRRFLCLVAILCHPSPPPMICIEEPELGIHPEIIPTLADLLREAASKTQLIVSTHSDLLVEEFAETPDSVIVFEKQGGRTVTRKLGTDELESWLDHFILGNP